VINAPVAGIANKIFVLSHALVESDNIGPDTRIWAFCARYGRRADRLRLQHLRARSLLRRGDRRRSRDGRERGLHLGSRNN